MGRTRSNKSFGDTGPPPIFEFEKRRSRRGTNPTCTDFGVLQKRLILYPSAFFCSNCEWYENQVTSGGGNRISRDSRYFACQANHYDWVYPREKWTVLGGNQFMSVDEICKEEQRSQRESELEKRGSKKRKHHIMIREVATIDDDESDSVIIAENAADKSGDVSCDKEYSNAPSEVVVLAASSKAADILEQQQSTTIADLEKQVAALEKQLHQARQNAEHWKTRYMEKVAVD